MNHKYTEEQIEYLIKIAPGNDTFKITEQFNKQFNLNLKRTQLRGAMKNRGIKNGLSKTFRCGMDPWNKGSKGICKPNSGSFKKGNKPYNYAEVGTELIKSDGYVYTKTAEPNIWKQTHRLNYEKEHGKVPHGHVLIFLDGNKHNTELDNLELVTQSELLILNRRKLLTNDKDLNTTGVLVAKTLDRVYKLKKEISS